LTPWARSASSISSVWLGETIWSALPWNSTKGRSEGSTYVAGLAAATAAGSSLIEET
jgi:hypothetical protein